MLDGVATKTFTFGETPPTGLWEKEFGADPGGEFYFDWDTKVIVASPQATGNYTVWLLVENKDGHADDEGLAEELDTVAVGRHGVRC
jgi:hypothetical protein